MDTKSEIIRIGDILIREKGYNAFSFSDISQQLKIKNASIHYHFPTKTHLGIAIIHVHRARLEHLVQSGSGKSPLENLNSFFSIYTNAKKEDKVCLVGSLATDLYTVDVDIQKELKRLVHSILKWVTETLESGKKQGVFHFDIDSRVKALMIITNMLAALQLTRLTNKQDFHLIKQTIINSLITGK
ncbi:MAG: putative transcriptional regulator, TetR family [uncultured Segetibacter sp.]|uniref:Putative transcriptional regulator, TetR family n=1 Tax=uncultured Segetibacter sp. TaxID=481133 RepID=A0A6J4RI23_9BACT|nr:MAG: putative transcriptional regulator, TetR family [uncultured Segetibacter sp.]